jgi:coenzyme PQQ precursor peptide PqqA
VGSLKSPRSPGPIVANIARAFCLLLCRHVLLLPVNERPNLIALNAAYGHISHVGIVVARAGTPNKVFQEFEDGVTTTASFSTLTENSSMPHTGYLMEWTEPQFEEISLGCEINSYACAEI